MTETVWINIPLKYKSLLDSWSNYYSYDTEDTEIGKLLTYRMTTDSDEYISLINFLEEKKLYFYIFRRIYRFTKKEIESAEILQFWVDDDAQDSINIEPTTYRCESCGEKVPILKRKTLHVDQKKIKKYDITAIYDGSLEIIISENLKKSVVE